MREKKRTSNPAFRYTTHGTAVRIIEKLLNNLYLVEALTKRNGAFVTMVAEADLKSLGK